MATADWWVVNPGSSPSNASSVPKGSQIISAEQGSSIDSSLFNQQPVTIGGKTYSRYMGPFTSKQAAQSAQPSAGGLTIQDLVGLGTDAAKQAASSNTNLASPGAAAAGGAVAGAVGSTVNDMLKPLFNSNLWMRVGEVLAGLILLGIGVNALFHGAPMKTVTKTAGKLAPLAMAG